MYKEFPPDFSGCSTVPSLNLGAPPGCSPFLDSETIRKHKVHNSLNRKPLFCWPVLFISYLRTRNNDNTNKSSSNESVRRLSHHDRSARQHPTDEIPEEEHTWRREIALRLMSRRKAQWKWCGKARMAVAWLIPHSKFLILFECLYLLCLLFLQCFSYHNNRHHPSAPLLLLRHHRLSCGQLQSPPTTIPAHLLRPL